MHTIDFLLIIPECFQIILINFFLLFAISFSYYKVRKQGPGNSTLQLRAYPFGSNSSMSTSSGPESSLKNEVDIPQKSKVNKQHKLIKDSVLNHIENKDRQSNGYKNIVQATDAYISGPVTKIEPIIQLVILSLICSSILYINSPIIYAIGLTDSMIWDSLGRLTSVLICASASGSLALGMGAISRFGRYEFIFIIWLSIIGMLCLIKSYNFLTFYLSVELQSLSFYMLAAMRSRTEASAEAGLKYFILSAFSSAILLLGITLIYAAIGSQNFADLNIIINYSYSQPETPIPVSLNVGLGCICISLLFKLAAAPFHAWIADVYEGSPTPITAFFAITAKVAAATALIRIVELHVTTFGLLPFIAALSLVVGSLSAMRQVKVKRLLAFSGVANVGWFLLALISGQWHLLMIHLIVYILLSTCLFSIFILPLFRTHPNLEYRQRTDLLVQKSGQHVADHGTDSLTIKYISDFNQLHKTNPSLAFTMVIAFFSLAGIPPFAGFYSKYLIINALTQTEQYLTISIALGSAILSAFYYIRVIKTIYFAPLELHFAKFRLDKRNSSGSFNSYLPLGWLKSGKQANVVQGSNSDIIKQTGFIATYSSSSDHSENRQNKTLTKKNQGALKMFTLMTISSNAYICALTTILTISFFIRPDYFCIWVMLS